MVVLLMASENPYCTAFVSIHPQVVKYTKKPRIKLFKKINKSVLSHITFYLEDDDHKPVDFNDETTSFTCQQLK